MKKGKKFIGALLAVVLLMNMPVVHANSNTVSDNFRVASFNIAAGKKPNIEAMSSALEQEEIDVVGVQEVDINTGRNNYDMLAKFKEYGYIQDTHFQKAIDYSGGQYGIGLLTRYQFTEKSGGALSNEGSYEARAYVRGVFEKEGHKVAIYNTHLTHESQSLRARQMQEVLDVMDADSTPYKILTGDFNTDQYISENYPMMKKYNLANGKDGIWHDTYNGVDPTMKINCIDNVVTSRNIKVNEVKMVETGLSDHNMLYIDCQLLDQEEPSRQLLDYTLADAQAIPGNAYTESSYATLVKVINEAKNLAVTATQEQIDTMIGKLEKAISKLEEKVAPISDPYIYYNFDTDVNNQYEGYNGKLVNNPNLIEGYKNNSLEIGTGYVEIPGMQLGTKDFTISMWFKSNERKNDTIIFSNKTGDSGRDLGIFFCNYDGFFANAGTGSSRYDTSGNNRDRTVMDGDWHYLTIVGDRLAALSLYVDGELSSKNTSFAEIAELNLDTDDNYVIGAGSRGAYRQKGNIDEFKVYDYALDGAQVRKTYRNYINIVDKTELEELYENCLTLTETNYTQESWAEFRTVMNDVKTVLEKEDVTQEEINNALTVLQTTREALVEKVVETNKTALQIAVEMAGNVTEEQLDKVVPAVVTEFNAALAEARVILANDSATQEEVDASFARLSVAMHMLEFLKGDKAELQDLVDSTADLVEGNYTEESWSALQDALTEANTVLNNENAMQEEVDEAYDNLQAAINGLEEVEVVDKSLLEAMVNKVLGLEEDKYIASSWQAMLPELEAAQEVLGNEKATQAEVDEACDALTRGYLNLRLKPNKDLLSSLINKANGLNSASYTADTWAVVADEVMKAQAVLNNPEASEAEVKAAHVALTKALEGLEAKPGNTVDTSTPVKPGDTTASIKTGDNGLMTVFAGLTMLSLAGLSLLRRKED